jgi:hypothetical protein
MTLQEIEELIDGMESPEKDYDPSWVIGGMSLALWDSPALEVPVPFDIGLAWAGVSASQAERLGMEGEQIIEDGGAVAEDDDDRAWFERVIGCSDEDDPHPALCISLALHGGHIGKARRWWREISTEYAVRIPAVALPDPDSPVLH